jgi:glycosyltransferase involved in cell wall biosynthesis
MLIKGLRNQGTAVLEDTPNAFNLSWLWQHRKQIQILHIHFPQPFYAEKDEKASLSKALALAFNLLFARAVGYHTIFTLHDIDPPYELTPAWVDRLGHRAVIKLSKTIIVHCAEAKHLLKERFNRSKGVQILALPHYIDTYPNEISQEQARKKLGYKDPSLFIFGFIGGIRPNKGVDNLIRAFRQIKDPNLRLLIAGPVNKPASHAQYLQALSGSDRRIRLVLQNIPAEDLQIVLNAADVIVLPFSKILTSASTILAMSFRKPVIIPETGCLPELIKDGGGWLFDLGNVDDLIAVMQKAIEARDSLPEMGEQAYQKVVNQSPDAFGAQTNAIYIEK